MPRLLVSTGCSPGLASIWLRHRGLRPRNSRAREALAELDADLVEAFRPWAHQIELLQTIPGVGETVAQVIVAETGADMSRFPSAAHLAAWAGDARICRQTNRGWEAAQQQMVDRDAGRGGRFGWPDEGQELSVCSACLTGQSARHGTGPGRGCAFDVGVGVLDAHTRRALPRPRSRLAQSTQQRSSHQKTDRPAGTPRRHRDLGPSRLVQLLNKAPEQPDAASPCPRTGDSRVCGQQRSASSGVCP